MPDTFRLIYLDSGNNIVHLEDLENEALGVRKVRDSFVITPGARAVTTAPSTGRFSGSLPTSDRMENGTIAAEFAINATTVDGAIAKMEGLLADADRTVPVEDQFLQWNPAGEATRPTLFPIRGAPTYTVAYRHVEMLEGIVRITVTWPIAPLAEELPMTWWEDFNIRNGTSSVPDRILDLQNNGWLAPSGGFGTVGDGTLTPPTAPAGTQAAAIIANTARRAFTDGWVATFGTVTGTPGAGTPLFSPGLKYQAGDGKLVYAALTTSTNLAVMTWDGTTATSRANVAVTAITTSATGYTIRIRAEGNTITAELFIGVATYGDGTAPNNTISWTATAGWGSDRSGYPTAMSHKTAAAATPVIADFWVDPNAYINTTTPVERTVTIPGSAPAKVDLDFQFNDVANYPVFALTSWRPSITGLSGPVGTSIQATPILDSANLATTTTGSFMTSGWTSTADATAMGGFRHRVIGGASTPTSWTGASSFTWRINPTIWQAEDYSDQTWLQVWARMNFGVTSGGATNATQDPWRVRLRVVGDLTSGVVPTYSAEWGAEGFYVPPATVGVGMRLYPLGTIPINPRVRTALLVSVDVLYGTGVASGFAEAWVDYALLVPSSTSFNSLTGVSLDANYPTFVHTNTARRVVGSDLRGSIAASTIAARPMSANAALSGNRIEPTPGSTVFLHKFSNKVPLDPGTGSAGAEVLSHSAFVKYNITPRHHIAAIA